MRLVEIDSTLPQPGDFSNNPKYKTLRHLPFFDAAYQATKEQFLKLNDKAVSFVSLFDKNLKSQFQKFIDGGGVLEDFPDYDNPTNAELDKEMKQANDIYFQKKEKEMEFGGLPHPYSKPYHFVSTFNGKVSGQGPLNGQVLGKIPGSHSDWIKHGFKKSKRPDFQGSTTYFINATVLKHLVDTNKL